MNVLKQNINLYQMNTVSTPFLSVARILLLWTILAIIFLVMALVQDRQINNQQQKLTEITQRQNQLKFQWAKLNTHFTQKIQLPGVALVASSMKEKTALLEKSLLQLHNQMPAAFPLSAYLEGFAVHHVKGTFVSYFNIKNYGKEFTCEGVALTSPLVAQLLSSWQQMPPLVGTEFIALKMQQLKPNNTWVKFSLQAPYAK